MYVIIFHSFRAIFIITIINKIRRNSQRLVLGIIDMYEKDGLVPPIYMSANIKGGDEHNKELYKKFQKRIKPLC